MSVQLVPLASLSSLITKGTTPTTLGYSFTDEGVPFLRVQNISGGQVHFQTDTLFISEATHATLKRSQIQAGDVLVTIAGTIGRTGVVPAGVPELNCNQAVAIIRPTDRIDRQFLRYWLESADASRQMIGSTVTGTISNLSLSQLGELRIPLPPLPEQRRIAAILDQAETLRTQRRAALTQLDSLTQSLFLDMFGDPDTILKRWSVHELGTSLEFLTSGSRGWANYYADSGDLFLRIQNVRRDELSLDEVAYVNAPNTAEARRTLVQSGDVLLSITADLGRTAVVPDDIGPAFINQHLCILRTKAFVPRFLSAYLASSMGQRQVMGRNKHAVKAGLNFDDIRSFQIPHPPLPLQQTFTTRVQAIEALKTQHRAALAAQDALFASLQQRAFAGTI